MNGQVQAPVSGLAFAAMVAVLLFGVFFGILFNKTFVRGIRSWWRGIHLHPFEEPGPAREPIHPVPQPHDRGLHPRPPHIGKKEIPVHRKG